MIKDLPTDNLYKFMALAGLVLAIAAPYYAVQGHEAFQRRQESQVKLEAQVKAQRSLVEQRQEAVRGREKASDNARIDFKAALERETLATAAVEVDGDHGDNRRRKEEAIKARVAAGADLSNRENDLERAVRDMEPLLLDLQIQEEILKQATSSGGNAEQKIAATAMAHVYKASIAAIVVGITLSLAGFTLWYRNIQRFEDQIARNKARSSTINERDPNEV